MSAPSSSIVIDSLHTIVSKPRPPTLTEQWQDGVRHKFLHSLLEE